MSLLHYQTLPRRAGTNASMSNLIVVHFNHKDSEVVPDGCLTFYFERSQRPERGHV